jgi:hypothetical protein
MVEATQQALNNSWDRNGVCVLTLSGERAAQMKEVETA